MAVDEKDPGIIGSFIKNNAGLLLGTGAIAGVTIGGAFALSSFLDQLNPFGGLTETEDPTKNAVNAGIKGISGVASGVFKGFSEFGERQRGEIEPLPAKAGIERREDETRRQALQRERAAAEGRAQLAGITRFEGETREAALKRARQQVAARRQAQPGAIGTFLANIF